MSVAGTDLAGTPTTQGLKMRAEAYPARDAPHLQRLRAAGAIPIGHTNLASIGVRWHCVSAFGSFASTHPIWVAPACS